MKNKEEIEQLAENLYFHVDGFEEEISKGKRHYILGYTQCQEDNNTSKITRFEVIDENGRAYSKWNCSVELSYQDDGRTLKVFIKPLNKQE